MAAVAERGVWLADEAQRVDLAAFTERALRLDDAAVLRFRKRSDTTVMAWVATGFDVLAARALRGRVRPDDLSVGADQLSRALPVADGTGYVNPGFAMDSAWRGVLPPDTGFVHLDDVPARVMLDLARRGLALAREHGAHGPPVSLLDQEVVSVSSAEHSVGIPMRCVFALTAMGFLPQAASAGDDFAPESVAADEIVRVRVMPTWLRIDARFGSVYRRRGDPAVVLR